MPAIWEPRLIARDREHFVFVLKNDNNSAFTADTLPTSASIGTVPWLVEGFRFLANRRRLKIWLYLPQLARADFDKLFKTFKPKLAEEATLTVTLTIGGVPQEPVQIPVVFEDE